MRNESLGLAFGAGSPCQASVFFFLFFVGGGAGLPHLYFHLIRNQHPRGSSIHSGGAWGSQRALKSEPYHLKKQSLPVDPLTCISR